MFFNKVSDHFRVRFGRELVSFLRKLPLQGEIVLDDSVVRDDDAPFTVAMRVSVFLCWTAVGRPARMTESELAANRLIYKEFLQILQLS